MPWVKLDDHFFRNRKARAAGKDGRSLFLAGCCYSAAGLTDGHIPKGDLPIVCADADVKPSVVARLVDAGLWHEVDDGWEIHDFTALNPTAEEVKERRRQSAERQKKWRAARDASRNASTDSVSNAYPDPTRPGPKGNGSGGGSTTDAQRAWQEELKQAPPPSEQGRAAAQAARAALQRKATA